MAEKQHAGLSSAEAAKRLSEFGPNLVYVPTQTSFFGIASHEITEPMIVLLLVVGLLYSVWGKLGDAVTIFIVISLLVMTEVYNEYRAKKAIDSLVKIAAPKARTIRDGKMTELDAEDVVPGDLLVMSRGARIAADAIVIGSVGLQADESPLTGESFPRDKKSGDTVYAGTTVTSGEGEVEVLFTGKHTSLGKIASGFKTIKPPRTLLQTEMKALVGKLVFVAVFFSTIIPVIGIVRGQDLRIMILTGLSLSFATIPEELPIIITMVLGLGAYTMSKHNFLVKRLQGAETLGNASVIVTDKTGTLTEGEMKISSVYPSGIEKEIVETACGGLSQFVLSPMEAVIKKKAEELGLGEGRSAIFRQRSFGEGGKRTKSVIRKNGGGYRLFMTGAPEDVFACCSKITAEIRKRLDEESSRGRRVIAVSSVSLRAGQERLPFSEIENNLNLHGLISFEDPPRKGVKETISAAAGAGIRTIMVTGDHRLTAAFIAQKTGIPDGRVFEGRDIDSMTDEELGEAARQVSVFARTTPDHKYRIVNALQNNGEVVAVTGDGINDVLALKGADIGIAMGIRGDDVAKDAADAVLADDNYVTIARGIFEGRKFFDNLRKGIAYYLSVKIALVMIFLFPVILGVPVPFSPIQIIILELFMDLAASAGFVAEPEENNVYFRPPRDQAEKVFSGGVVADIFLRGLVLFLSVSGAYFYARRLGLELRETQTFAFSAWIFGHIFLAFVSRSSKESVFSIGVFTNPVINAWAFAAIAFLFLAVSIPFLGDRFNLAPIGITRIAAIAGFTLLVVGMLEIRRNFCLRQEATEVSY